MTASARLAAALVRVRARSAPGSRPGRRTRCAVRCRSPAPPPGCRARGPALAGTHRSDGLADPGERAAPLGHERRQHRGRWQPPQPVHVARHQARRAGPATGRRRARPAGVDVVVPGQTCHRPSVHGAALLVGPPVGDAGTAAEDGGRERPGRGPDHDLRVAAVTAGDLLVRGQGTDRPGPPSTPPPPRTRPQRVPPVLPDAGSLRPAPLGRPSTPVTASPRARRGPRPGTSGGPRRRRGRPGRR
jgi:hypothetical protein